MKFYNKYGKEINLVDFDYLNKQLLVNNDFQINQRGQSEYNLGYSVDMWFTKWGQPKLEVVDNGVIFSNTDTANNSVFMQLIKTDNPNRTFSSAFMIDKKRYEVTEVNPSSGAIIREFENFDFVISYNSDNQCIQVYIRIDGNKRIHIEYVDLFEGDIAYPHVKKKYTTDLLECRLYYIKKWINVVISYKYTDKEVKVYGEIPEMIKAPTCNIIEANCADSSSNGNELKTIKNNWVKDYYGYEARLEFLRPIHQSCKSVHILVELSCEET